MASSSSPAAFSLHTTFEGGLRRGGDRHRGHAYSTTHGACVLVLEGWRTGALLLPEGC